MTLPPLPPAGPVRAAPVMAPARPRRRHPLLALLLICVVFGAGMVAGAGATVIVITHRLRHIVQHPEELPDRLTARLTARLRLSADQRAQVHALLVQHQARLTAIRRDVQPEVEHELDSLHTDIAATLDPAQKQSWDTLYSDLKNDWLPPPPPAPATAP